MTSATSLRTALCRRLGIDVPIFGFSHSVDVTVALAECGGFPVFGAARETPDRIAEDIAIIRKRIGRRPFGVDLMYPKLAGDEPDRQTAYAKTPAAHRAFVDAIRSKYNVPPVGAGNFFSSQIRNQEFFRAQTEAVLASDADAVVTAASRALAAMDSANVRMAK